MHKKRIISLLLSCGAFLFALQIAGAENADRVESATVTEGKINVRGKPGFIGEVITQLDRGDKVTVLERINLENPKAGEPTNWAKIKLPENTPVWVFAPFIKDNKVTASRLNFRAGPGENWSVLGRIDRGTEVTSIRTVAEWMEIEAPTNAYAFIDLTLVQFDDTNGVPTIASAQPEQEKQESIATALPDTNQPPSSVAAPGPNTNIVAAATSPTPEVATATSAVPEPIVEPEPASSRPEPATNLVTATTTETPATPDIQEEAVVPPGVTPLPPPETLPQVAEPLPRGNEPLPKRVVRREGIIRATKSIQAPTWYELVHAQTGKTINYLYDSKLGVKLKDYRGQKVVVSGEEAIDPRWPNTPILDLETLDVLP